MSGYVDPLDYLLALGFGDVRACDIDAVDIEFAEMLAGPALARARLESLRPAAHWSTCDDCAWTSPRFPNDGARLALSAFWHRLTRHPLALFRSR